MNVKTRTGGSTLGFAGVRSRNVSCSRQTSAGISGRPCSSYPKRGSGVKPRVGPAQPGLLWERRTEWRRYPNGVAAMEDGAATPLGLGASIAPEPRVGPISSGQPWALRHCPFGASNGICRRERNDGLKLQLRTPPLAAHLPMLENPVVACKGRVAGRTDELDYHGC